MRVLLCLLAVMALLVSGIHAGPAEAHEGDPAHISIHHAEHHDEGDTSQPDAAEHYGSHHHCPSFVADASPEPEVAIFLGNARIKPVDMSPLVSTGRAPLLAPPKA